MTANPVSSRGPSLPSTRLVRRRQVAAGWWMGVGLALVVNSLVVIVLVRVGHLVTPSNPAPPPLSVRSFTPPEPPPPEPPRPETVTEEVGSTTESAPVVTIPLPSVELHRPSTDSGGFILPDVPFRPDLPILPTTVPAFASIGAGDVHIDLPRVGTNQPTLAFDRPPTPQAGFSLDRFYPQAARLGRVEGETRVQVELDARGQVMAVEILTSTPPQVFDEAAAKAVRAMRFNPAERAGKPVPSRVVLPLGWNLTR